MTYSIRTLKKSLFELFEVVAGSPALMSEPKRYLYLFCLGLIAATSLPPYGIPLGCMISLTLVVFCIDHHYRIAQQHTAPKKRLLKAFVTVALSGWWWSMGYLTLSMWWLLYPFAYVPYNFMVAPLAILGLIAFLSLFYAMGFSLAFLFWGKYAERSLGLALGLSLCEWLRGTILTGFPWNSLGLIFGQTLCYMQPTAYLGLYGLSFLVVLFSAAPSSLVHYHYKTHGKGYFKVMVCVFFALTGFGLLRSLHKIEYQPMIHLRLVQPDFPIRTGHSTFPPDNALIQNMLALSQMKNAQPDALKTPVTHIFWPETALPYLGDEHDDLLDTIRQALLPKQSLVTGILEYKKLAHRPEARFYNTMVALNGMTDQVETYDKSHLTPFGEYIPLVFREVARLLGVKQFTYSGIDFGDHTLSSKLRLGSELNVLPLICYEAIFQEDIYSKLAHWPGQNRVDAFVNIVNDQWFNHSPGVYQHFLQARLQAVTFGVPLIRASNSGISAVVDPYGRVIAELPFGVEGILDSPLPKSLEGSTTYSRYGNLMFFYMVFAAALWGLLKKYSSRNEGT